MTQSPPLAPRNRAVTGSLGSDARNQVFALHHAEPARLWRYSDTPRCPGAESRETDRQAGVVADSRRSGRSRNADASSLNLDPRVVSTSDTLSTLARFCFRRRWGTLFFFFAFVFGQLWHGLFKRYFFPLYSSSRRSSFGSRRRRWFVRTRGFSRDRVIGVEMFLSRHCFFIAWQILSNDGWYLYRRERWFTAVIERLRSCLSFNWSFLWSGVG